MKKRRLITFLMAFLIGSTSMAAEKRMEVKVSKEKPTVETQKINTKEVGKAPRKTTALEKVSDYGEEKPDRTEDLRPNPLKEEGGVKIPK